MIGRLIGGLVFSLFACLFGVVFIAIIFGDVRDYFDSSDWQQANGEVIESYVERSSDSDGDTTYNAYVRYFYFVNDQRYENDRLSFGGDISSSGRSGKQEKVDQYPAGQAVTVYYDPDDPSNSVLERSAGFGLWAFLAVGVCAIGFAVLSLILTPIMMLRGMF